MFTLQEVKDKVKKVLLAQNLDINEFLVKIRPPVPTPRQVIQALEELEKEQVIDFDGKLLKLQRRD